MRTKSATHDWGMPEIDFGCMYQQICWWSLLISLPNDVDSGRWVGWICEIGREKSNNKLEPTNKDSFPSFSVFHLCSWAR
jgi:hypothetical protein